MPNIHFNYAVWKITFFVKNPETWFFDQILSTPCFMGNNFFPTCFLYPTWVWWTPIIFLNWVTSSPRRRVLASQGLSPDQEAIPYHECLHHPSLYVNAGRLWETRAPHSLMQAHCNVFCSFPHKTNCSAWCLRLLLTVNSMFSEDHPR